MSDDPQPDLDVATDAPKKRVRVVSGEILHLNLDALLKLRASCQQEYASAEAVHQFLRASLLFVRDLMSEEVFRRAMRSGQEGEGLLLLANRFASMEPLLADNWPSDFSFPEMVRELFAIANGDAPRIIKSPPKSGKSLNAHALLELKLEAHVWYKVLDQLGMKAPDRQDVVMGGYGVTKDAFDKWRQEAKEKLGSDYVSRYLVTAVDTRFRQAMSQPDPTSWSKAQARLDGDRYKQELRA